MELWLDLCSPIWWASLVLATAGLWFGSKFVLRKVGPPGGDPPPGALVRSLRLRGWVLTLLCIANLAMLGVLSLGSLRTPQWAGPIGLALLVLCMSTVALAWATHAAAERGVERDRSKPEAGR